MGRPIQVWVTRQIENRLRTSRQTPPEGGSGHIQPKTSVRVDALLQIIDFVEGQSR
jgi:hypothetical protein